jgi:O-antigen/teichoic acid export membrane protein
MSAALSVTLILQGVPPRGLVVAMLLSYALGFAGMLLAYLNYRKRHRNQKPPDEKSPR